MRCEKLELALQAARASEAAHREQAATSLVDLDQALEVARAALAAEQDKTFELQNQLRIFQSDAEIRDEGLRRRLLDDEAKRIAAERNCRAAEIEEWTVKQQVNDMQETIEQLQASLRVAQERHQHDAAATEAFSEREMKLLRELQSSLCACSVRGSTTISTYHAFTCVGE